ncbi:nitroreductase family protein [Methanosphaera sp.]
MELIDVMINRRSHRKYTEEKIEQEKIDQILKAGLLAPTSRNRKPCEFVVVNDKEVLAKLSNAKKAGSGMIADASHAIVVIADSTKADTWVEDSSIALTYMDLVASSMNLATCWVQIHLRKTGQDIDSEDKVREILDLTDNYRVVGILSMGIKQSELPPHNMENLEKEKIRYI